MRKYTRLSIAVIAFFSIVSMFVYRYKYHNLLSVIEIKNFFISEPVKHSKYPLQNSNDNLTSEIISNPSHWTEIFDGIYVYSSHVVSKHVISLAYSNGVSVTELKSITCSLWFENEGKNLKSNLDIHLLNRKNVSFLFYIECRMNHMHDFGNPDAVTFMKNNISMTMPIFHKHLYTGPFAACVSPLSPVFSDGNKIVEFLIYHSNLGIKHFILYYTVFSTTVRELLINLATECDITIEFLPWITPLNFGHNKVKLQPYFIDCIFHVSSLNHSDFLFLLDVNNFIALEGTSNLKKLVYSNSPFDFLQLEQKLFCLEYPNYIIAEELKIKFKILLKTKISNYEGQQLNVIYDLKQMMLNIGQIHGGFKKWLLTKSMQSYKKIKSTSANIFSYIDCETKVHNFSNTSYIENKKMWLFKRVFFESCIYKHVKSILDIHNT